MTPSLALWVAVAGGLGSLARYAVMVGLGPASARWPVSTVTVNLAGAAAIGLVVAVLASRGADSRWRIVIATGFLGGFTTFSALALDTVALIERRAWAAIAAYLVVTIAGGVAACAGGLWLGRQLA